MNSRILYWIGVVILFLGLLWMLLPQATHEVVSGQFQEEENSDNHFEHVIYGFIGLLIGLGTLIFEDKYRK